MGLMGKDVKEMTEEELRAEMEQIRGMRAGRGRERRKVSAERRMSKQQSEKQMLKKIEEQEGAEWV